MTSHKDFAYFLFFAAWFTIAILFYAFAQALQYAFAIACEIPDFVLATVDELVNLVDILGYTLLNLRCYLGNIL